MNSGDYPAGAQYDSKAPYNQEEKEPIEVDVTVSLSISKTFTIKVTDYESEIETNEDGKLRVYDFSDCDLENAVLEQVVLPNNLAEFTNNIFKDDLDLKAAGMCKYLKDAIKDCSNWEVDDLTVIKE